MPQDLTRLGDEQPLQFSGSISFEQIMYRSSRELNRRDPYTYVLSGHLNTSFYGWSIPISYTLSNYNSSFRQPFNQFGMRPTYKGLKLHIGYSSLSFSPYTLNGHIFLGGGAEYQHKSGLYLAVMGGRFRTAVPEDTLAVESQVPAYERWGHGFRAGYKKEGDMFLVSLFQGKDDPGSIPYVPRSTLLLPAQNRVLGVQASRTFAEKLEVKLDAARSTVTRDISLDSSRSLLGFKSNRSTYYYHAVKGELGYRFSDGGVSVSYERVDPGYETMGAYYFNNDLENLSLNGNYRFNAVSITGRLGLQRNNLRGQEMNDMRRTVGALNVSYSSPSGASVTGQYSTYTTFTNLRSDFLALNQLSPYDNLDTLDYRQINRNTSLNFNLPVARNGGDQHMISSTMVYQASAEEGGNNASSSFLNFSVYYLIASRVRSISIMMNAYRNQTVASTVSTVGPTFSWSQYFFERKFRTTLASSLNRTFDGPGSSRDFLILRWISSLTLKKSHTLDLNLVQSNRGSAGLNEEALSETTLTLGYRYNF